VRIEVRSTFQANTRIVDVYAGSGLALALLIELDSPFHRTGQRVPSTSNGMNTCRRRAIQVHRVDVLRNTVRSAAQEIAGVLSSVRAKTYTEGVTLKSTALTSNHTSVHGLVAVAGVLASFSSPFRRSD
jgi:hypothetical protein